MSANSALIVLRSPSASSALETVPNHLDRFSGAGDGAAGESTTPHSPQNFSSGSFGAPQRPQLVTIGAPHSAQNLRFSRLSRPQLEHRIGSTQKRDLPHLSPGASGRQQQGAGLGWGVLN